MKESFKTPAMNDFIDSIFARHAGRKESINKEVCFLCANDANIEAMDQLSRKEFSISGMCQKCQDEVFNGDEE